MYKKLGDIYKLCSVDWLGDIIVNSKRAIQRRKGVQRRPTKYLQNGHNQNGVRDDWMNEYIQHGYSDEG